ncbi:MAG TPA: MBL fold metallo-hydrolase [Smithellaceae bacterium]|nr:MBL fold metallo-hydrolase [Smithellaceae bacterium]
MSNKNLNTVEKVEILTLQDNYVDLTVMDNNNIINRPMPLLDGKFKRALLAEHGFSALVRTTRGSETHAMLFDTGFSETGSLYNARVLEVDLSSIEAIAFSHGHMDHTGGFKEMAAAIPRKGLPVFAHPAVFRSPRYLKYAENIKVYLPSLKREDVAGAGMKLVETKDPQFINDVLFLGEIPRKTDFEKGIPVARYEEDGIEKFDAIEDDTSLVMNLKDKGLVILSGCAHSGIVNTVNYAREITGMDKVHVIMGGFHLGGPMFEPIIGRTTEELQKINPDYIIPTHCTGRKAVNFIEAAFEEHFILNMSGTKLTFS